MATKRQLARIHILRKELGLDDAAYRAFLENRFGVKSSKDLSEKQANFCIEQLSGQKAGNRQNYERDPGQRDGMASPKQLRMICALWAEVSFFEDKQRREDALDRFLYKRFQCWLRSVPQHKVGPIKKTLLTMKANKKGA